MPKNIDSGGRYLLVVLVLIVLCVFSVSYAPTNVNGRNNLSDLTTEINGWEFNGDFRIDEDTHEALEPQTLIFRQYRSEKGQDLVLAVVYHQNDRWGAHDPIVCYTSQGWKVIEKTNVVKIKKGSHGFPVNRFVVKKGGITKLVYFYWFSSNKKITASRNRQMFDMVLNGIVHGFTESGFVRISVTLSPLNQGQVVSEINDFTHKFTQILEKFL